METKVKTLQIKNLFYQKTTLHNILTFLGLLISQIIFFTIHPNHLIKNS